MQLGLALLLIALGASLVYKGIKGYSWQEFYANVLGPVKEPGNVSKTDPMKESSGRKGGV